MNKDFHSELLLPAGSVDSFRAAIRGSANAVYLGLKQFNARMRASNFGEEQLAALVQEAHQHGVKLYITLNTVIKNQELSALLNLLSTLEANRVDAIIIQDWGVHWLAKKYFPKLALHASTQMAIHNSLGVNHAADLGFERTVLARELSMPELEGIAAKAGCELEVFVHGALCYSFSGMCFFSSFVGGRGANRGMCSQVCRMRYKDMGKSILPFNLRDNQQLSRIVHLQQLGIHSLKIEGRMKSAEYVHRVAKAYRSVLDGGELSEAEDLLQYDFARAKTGYFLSGDLSLALASDANTGIYLGRVQTCSASHITFESSEQLQEGDRLRIQKLRSKHTISMKVESLQQNGSTVRIARQEKEKIATGDHVFWIGRKTESFPSRLMNVPPISKRIPPQQQAQMLSFKPKNRSTNTEIHLRLSDLGWLEFVRPEELTCLILSLSRRAWKVFNYDRKFFQKYLPKIALELPKFIAEGNIAEWKEIIDTAHAQGVRHFVLSHLSQKRLIPTDCTLTCNEQVYVFNDAAAELVDEQTNSFSYPLEIDWESLSSFKNTQGVFYMYSMPELFYSRMSVRLKEGFFSDAFGKTYRRGVQDGMTIITPTQAVSHMQHRKKLEAAGFHRFLFDLKHQAPDANLLKQLFVSFKKGEGMPDTSDFNFSKTMY